MKNICISLILWALMNTISRRSEKDEWTRINQLGYRNNDIKIAVLLCRKSLDK
jgi:hypothetical protein